MDCVCACVRRLQIHQDLRDDLAKVKTLEALANVSQQLKLRCQVTDAPAGEKKANANAVSVHIFREDLEKS